MIWFWTALVALAAVGLLVGGVRGTRPRFVGWGLLLLGCFVALASIGLLTTID